MSGQITDKERDLEQEAENKVDKNVFRSFNYIGTKETVAYLFNDWSNAFNINNYSQRFIWLLRLISRLPQSSVFSPAPGIL